MHVASLLSSSLLAVSVAQFLLSHHSSISHLCDSPMSFILLLHPVSCPSVSYLMLCALLSKCNILPFTPVFHLQVIDYFTVLLSVWSPALLITLLLHYFQQKCDSCYIWLYIMVVLQFVITLSTIASA